MDVLLFAGGSTLVAGLAGLLAAPTEPLLVADLRPQVEAQGTLEGDIDAPDWARAGDRLFFLRPVSRPYEAPTGRVELWVTDGTAAGTELVRELAGTSRELHGAGLPDGRLLFAASDEASGEELWVSDGTPAGTRLLADLCSGSCSGRPARNPTEPLHDPLSRFVPFGGELLFAATTAQGTRIHAASGGTEGARLVSEIDSWMAAVSDGQLLFLSPGDTQGAPWRLWRTDGQPGSEQQVGEVELALPRVFASFRDTALLVGTGDIDGDRVLESALVYRVDPEGATLLAASPSPFRTTTAVGANLAFVSYTGVDGSCRLLRTDGSPAGTSELSLPGEGGSLCPDALTTVGDRLFFGHRTELGAEPWTSDGSSAGTVLLADLVAGAGDSHPRWFTSSGAQAYFVAQTEGGKPVLWRSDGTPAGTVALRELESVDRFRAHALPLGSLDDLVVLMADDGGTGLELSGSDGTAEGTGLIANLAADVGSSAPRGFARTAGAVIFQTSDAAEQELTASEWYRYDGVESPFAIHALSDGRLRRTVALAGEHLLVAPVSGAPAPVHSIDPEGGGSEVVLEGQLFGNAARAGSRALVRTDRVLTSTIVGPEALWGTDGTAAGTHRLLEPPPQGEIELGSFPSFDHDGVWFRYLTPDAGAELWRSDGTPGGTRLAADLAPGPEWSGAAPLGATEDRLFVQTFLGGESVLVALDRALAVRDSLAFEGGSAVGLRGRLLTSQRVDRNDPASPRRLMITDATEEATRTLGTFAALGPFLAARGLAFFAADTHEHGRELWVTDGTPEGTRLVADLVPGQESSAPRELQEVDGLVLFSARTAETGAEAWVTDGTAEGTIRLGDVAPGPRGSDPSGFTAIADEVVFAAHRNDVGRELFAVERDALRRPCVASEQVLCLGDGRFQLEAEWLDRATGTRGRGHAVPLREDTGQFWFFDQDNIELVAKVLDATSINDHHWVFFGALSDVAYWVTVVDTWTGHTRSYTNQQGSLCGANDISALPAGERLPFAPRAVRTAARAELPPAPAARASVASAACDSAAQLCLQGGRFAVDVEWRTGRDGGSAGIGRPVHGTDDSGFFWFFDPENIELVVKVLDGRAINDSFWVYYGALSDVEYRLRVTDTETGSVRLFVNPEGTLCGGADVDPFDP